MSRPGSVIAAIAVAVALAGCVPQTVAETPPPAATATGTPTPTATAAALPTPALDLTCADILSDAEASEILHTPVQLRVDENDLRGVYTIAQRQAGLLSCVWGGEDRTDNGWDQSIALDILPDAVAVYDEGVMQVDDGAIVYTVGDLSEYLCDAGPGYSQCTANLLVGGHWAQILAQSYGTNAGRTQASAEAGMITLLDGLAAKMAAATASPEWDVPSGVVAGAFCGDAASTAAVESAFGLPGLSPVDNSSSGVPRAATVAEDRGGEVYCSWTPAPSGYSVSVTVVPGGSWAFAQFAASPPKVGYSLPTLEPVTVEGADSAFTGCGDGCYLLASAGGSAIAIYGEVDPDFLEHATALLASIVAAG